MNGATYKKVRIRAGSGRRYRDNGASVAVRRQLTPITGTAVMMGNVDVNVSEPHTQLSYIWSLE